MAVATVEATSPELAADIVDAFRNTLEVAFLQEASRSWVGSIVYLSYCLGVEDSGRESRGGKSRLGRVLSY